MQLPETLLRKGMLLGAAVALLVGGVPSAQAQPNLSQVVQILEDDGFSGVCVAPCFVLEKTVEVFFSGNASAPGVCPAGNDTYVYTLTHLGSPPSTLSPPGVPIDTFTVIVDSSLVTSAGFIPGAGIAPVSTVINPSTVSWGFPQSSACPGCLDQGKTSEQLFICAPAATSTPASTPDNVSTTAIVLDAPGECIVPTPGVVVGEPMPCTIGFWKNRVQGKKGLDKFFPGTDLDDVVAQALGLSMGVFTTADETGCPDNFDDLLCALQSKGNRTTEERARQQLAATLLNLAAGDLFPDNGKCVLFEENNITTNACGSGLTVGTAVGTSKSGITSGNSQAEHEALECLDDINNEIGVVQ